METANLKTQTDATGRKIPLLGKTGISGSTVKIIAIAVMLIDHIGAVIVERMLLNAGALYQTQEQLQQGIAYRQDEAVIATLLLVDLILRMIGRLGFPIFCFLLIEGFMHTKNVWNYALRLGVFALISEVPFDLAFSGSFFYMDYQNVFFTLFIGLTVMIAYDRIQRRENWPGWQKKILGVIAILLGMGAAALLKTDYAAIGVLCVMIMFLFRKNRLYQVIAGCIAFCWEITAPLAFVPIAMYNGKRGLNMKYVFYAFYPVHLLLLYIIARCMGIA